MDQESAQSENEKYRGNANLRPKGVKQGWTKKQIKEYIKCKEDPVYFIKKYIKITSIDHGIIPFELWDFQEKLINDIHNNRFTIGLWSRQSGKSSTVAAYMLHYVLFNSNKTCAILANKVSGANEILSRIQMAYELLPFWLKMGVVDWNKGSFNLENRSRIIASATSSSAIRGQTINFLLLDEFAFIPKNMAEDFFRSVYPTISSGQTSKICIISTPWGMNHYYKLWHDAAKGRNLYVPNLATWRAVPDRDEKWKKETIANIGEEAFNQEYEVEFLGSSGTLISGDKLKSMTWMDPLYESEEGLRIYYPPVQGHQYIATVDVAEGLGLDASVINIFDASTPIYEQVAIYRSHKIDPLLLPDIIFSICTKYNEALVLIELNNLGAGVANDLYIDLEYENILFTTQNGRNGQVLGGGFSGKTQFGLKTTALTKRKGCSLVKSMIENDMLKINDFTTYNEFTTFVRKKNSYEAEDGCNDDAVMTCVLIAWVIGQQYYKDNMEKDLKAGINQNSISDVENQLVPFGLINDGMEDGDIHSRISMHEQSFAAAFERIF